MKKHISRLLQLLLAFAIFTGISQISQAQTSGNSAAAKGLAFSFKTGGPIRGNAVINGNTVFFGSGDGKLYAIDKLTGQQYWQFKTGGPVFCTPAIAKNTVYFTSRDKYLYALQAATGRPVWKFKFGEDVSAQNFWDYYLSSPVVENGVLYIGSGDGFLYALNAQTGNVIWKYNASSRIRSTPAVEGGKIVFGTMAGYVIAVDMNGNEQWKFATDGIKKKFTDNDLDNTSVFCNPAIHSGVVVFGGRDFVLYALSLQTGKQLWRYNHPNSWVLSAGINDTIALAGSGVAAFVHASNLTTGKQLWRFKAKSAVYSYFTFAGGLVYFGDLTGNIYALDYKTGQQKWVFPMGRPGFSTPVVSGGMLYCSSDEGRLFAVHTVGSSDTSFIHPKRFVYWQGTASDSGYHDFGLSIDLWVRDYLKRQGYEQLNATALKNFMTGALGNAAVSVVVFADNKIPKELVDRDAPEKSLIRKYLEAGGKVALLSQINPLFVITDPATGSIQNVEPTVASKVFGIHFSTQDFGNGLHYAPYTAEGHRWGLWGDYTIGFWPIDPKEVTTVLATDEYGKAASWIKNYGGPEGSGLLELSVNPPWVLGQDFFPMRAAIEYGICW